MAESTLSVTRGELLRATSFHIGWGRDSAKWGVNDRSEILQDLIDSGVRQVYFPPVLPGEDRAHRWSWMEPVASLTIRAAASGVLFSVATRDGSQLIMRATTAVFSEGMVGESLKFTESDTAYKITEFISADTVRVQGNEETDFGFAKSGTLTSEPSIDVTRTKITATTAKFLSVMVGDELKFTTSGKTYTITEFVDASNVKVQGDASAETGIMTVMKTATVALDLLFSLVINEPVYRQDMADDSDTITGGPNTLTITGFTSSTSVRVSGFGDPITAGTVITINKALTLSAAAVELATTRFTDAQQTFVAADVGKYIVFEPPGTASRTYEITQLLGADAVLAVGDGRLESQGDPYLTVTLSVVSSNAPVYASPSSTVTITTSSFVEEHVGRAIKFRSSGNKYIIISRTNATIVVVSGNAGGEKVDDDIYVVGPSDLAAGDAFTVTGTGGDYDLPDDYGAPIGDLTFDPEQASADVLITGEGRIRSLRQSADTTGRPTLAAVRPKSSDGTKGQRFELLLHPAPNADYTLTFRYAANPQALTEDQPYPLGGAPHAELFLASCLAVGERRLNDERGIKFEEFMEKLISAVTADRTGTAPRYLGQNVDRSSLLNRSMTRDDLRQRTDVTASYNGVFY